MTQRTSRERAARRPARDQPVEPSLLVPGQVPAEWLDRLLVLGCELPVAHGLGRLGEAVVDALASIVPTCAFGVCIADPPAAGGQHVVRRLPAGLATAGDRDPSRLFPSLARERVLVVSSDPAGTTLHCAGDDVALLDDDGPVAHLLERAALVLAAGLRATRANDRAASDAQQLQYLEAQVVQSEKLASLGQIAAGVVHELNNPLTSILTYTEYLRRKAERHGGDEADVERLRRIEGAAERILRFSRDLVAYARPSTGVRTALDVHAAIDQALGFCEHEIVASETHLVRSYAADLPRVHAVAAELTQVFVNLVTNACHAMTPGGTLTIATERAGDRVRVRVRDTGHGIEPGHLERVFDPFFTTKSEGRGSGLGLSIVAGIVTSAGGSISVESTPGQGASFDLELRVAP